MHVDALCGAMARSGVSVTLYAAKVVGPLPHAVRTRSRSCPSTSVPSVRGEDADRTRITLGRYFDRVGDLLARRPPDWVHERLSLFAGAGNMLAAGLGLPRIVEVNAPVADERRRHFSLSLVEEADEAERDALMNARVTAVSAPLVAWSRRRCGVGRDGPERRRHRRSRPTEVATARR